MVLGSVAALGVLALVSLARRRRLSGRWGLVICALIALAPAVAWYVALNNHSQIHPLLVYRSLPIAFGAVPGLLRVPQRGVRLTMPRASLAGPDGRVGR